MHAPPMGEMVGATTQAEEGLVPQQLNVANKPLNQGYTTWLGVVTLAEEGSCSPMPKQWVVGVATTTVIEQTKGTNGNKSE